MARKIGLGGIEGKGGLYCRGQLAWAGVDPAGGIADEIGRRDIGVVKGRRR